MQTRRDRAGQHLVLREWEVWHTYSTYFARPIEDLKRAAKTLVESGAALCAVHSDGSAQCRYIDGRIWKGDVTVRVGSRTSAAKIHISPHLEEPNGNFLVEALLWAGRLRVEELILTGDHPWLPSYIRLFLGRCDLVMGRTETTCYPVIKLYESGVILVELRFIGPNRPVRVDEFIREYVNLHNSHFDLMRVPPTLASLIARAGLQNSRENWPILKRWNLMRAHKLMDLGFSEIAAIHRGGDFTFELTAVNRGDGENAYDTLASFAMSIVDAFGYVLADPRSDIQALIVGVRRPLTRGHIWTGRPHIHIVRHANQAEEARENEEHHRADFGWILARGWYRDQHALGVNYLPENHRSFGDYGVYFNNAVTLWVWARRGLRNAAKWAEPNRAHLIYSHTIIIELLEYGYMLHRQLLERAGGHGTPDQVLSARRNLALLRQEMEQFSHFGEVRELLRHGWEVLGVPGLRDRIAEVLAVRESETALVESRASERRNRVLTFTFGLIAIPPIAADVIQPLWEYAGIWRPATDEAYKLIMVGIAVGLVGASIRAWDAWVRWRVDHD